MFLLFLVYKRLPFNPLYQFSFYNQVTSWILIVIYDVPFAMQCSMATSYIQKLCFYWLISYFIHGNQEATHNSISNSEVEYRAIASNFRLVLVSNNLFLQFPVYNKRLQLNPLYQFSFPNQITR